jgi:hypothetical protein
MNRVWQRLAAYLGILALLFAQLAVSAYACPMTSADKAAATSSTVASPCDQLDQAEPNLCDKHCNDSAQSQAAVPCIHGAFVPGFIAVVGLSSPPALPASAGNPALHHATSPPATIRNCCFRI